MDGAPERLWRFGERQLQNRLVGLCAFSPIAMEPRWMGHPSVCGGLGVWLGDFLTGV